MPEQGYRYDPTEQRGVKPMRLNRGERAWSAANELDDKYIYMHRILLFRIGNRLIDWKCYFSCQMLPTHMTFEGLLKPVVGQPHPYPPSVQRQKKEFSSAFQKPHLDSVNHTSSLPTRATFYFYLLIQGDCLAKKSGWHHAWLLEKVQTAFA